MSVAALRSKGVVSQGTGPRTPGAPPTVAVGDWLILYAGGFADTLSAPTLAGWTKLNSNATSVIGAVYVQIATSTTPTMPAVDMGSTHDQFAYCEAWSGLPSAISGNVTFNERAVNLTSGWQTGSITPPVDGCLLIYLGVANKTASTNGATIGNWTAGGGTFTQNASAMPAGGGKCRWVAESLLQTTKTGISLGAANTTSIAETSPQTSGGFIFAIKPSVNPPAFTANPAKTSQTTSSVSFSATADSVATLYGVAVTGGDTAPSAAQIIAGQNHAGTAAAGSANIATAAGSAATLSIGSLSAGTYDFYFVVSNANGNSSVQSVTGVALVTPLTLSVSVGSANVDGFTLNCTSTATGTLYAVAVTRGSAAPTAAQVKNGTEPGKLVTATKACTSNVATTISLTGLAVPVCDVYVIVNDGTNNSSVSVFASQMKAPAAGRQYVTLSALSITSPLTVAGIPAAVNDIIDTIAATPIGYSVVVSSGGDFRILAQGDVSREILPFNFYDDSAGGFYYSGDSQLVVNDKPPVATTSPGDAFNFRIPSGTALPPFDLNYLLTDADGDPVVITDVNGVLSQFGLLITADGHLTGLTPSFKGDQTVALVLQGTDQFGASVQVTGTFTVGQVAVPNVVGLPSEAVAKALLLASFLREHGTGVSSQSPIGTVLTQSPLADDFADPNTVVEITYSIGNTGGGTTTPPPPVIVSDPGSIVARIDSAALKLSDLEQLWGADLSLSNTQDVQLVSGSDLGKERVLRRLLTNPGDYAFHPNYGAGLRAYVGQPLDKAKITAVITSQIFLEDVVAKSPAPVITVNNTASADGSTLSVSIAYTDSFTGKAQILSFSLSK